MSLDHSGWALDCKVYIGGLGSGADKEELEREFRCYGNLKNVWVARNPPGFAFIEYTDPRDAEDAVRALDGILMNGRRIMVQMSTGKTRGRSGLTRSRSRSRSPYGRSRSPSPHRKYRHRSRSRRSFSYGTSRSRSGSRSEDSYRNYSRSRRHKKRGTSSRHYHSSYSRSRSRSRSCGSDTSTEYTPQRRRRSYSLSSHSRCSSISRASSRVSSNRSQSRHRTRSRSQSRCSDSPGPLHSQVGGVESKQRTPHGRSQSRSRSKSSSQSRSRTPIGRVQNRIGGSRLSREKNTSDSRTLCDGINRRSSIDGTDSGDNGVTCQCSSPDIKSNGDVSITSEVAVQTDPYLLLHFVQKCPEILSETFLRLDRDNVLNNCNYPEVIPSVHQRAGRLKTSSERYRNNELVS